MTKEEINSVKISPNAIHLSSKQFINLGHDKLKSVINIMWSHEDHKLTMQKIDSVELFNEIPVNLKSKNVLILNPKHVGHERLYKLEVDELKQRIELKELHDMSQYGLDIKIIDKQ